MGRQLSHSSMISLRMLAATVAALLLLLPPSATALMIGKRKIQCTTPLGGGNDDALLDYRSNLPGILGFVAAQAVLPSLTKCPSEAQLFAPWFLGNPDAGGGICPPEYWNLAALGPGALLVALASALHVWASSNRLLITQTGLGTHNVQENISNFQETYLFKDIQDFNTTPLGLVLAFQASSSERPSVAFLPLFWDQVSVQALLEDRLQEKT